MPKIIVDGLKTHYEEYGEGKPLVLIHGAQGTVEGFDGMIKILRNKYRVITPSLPGRSGSESMSGEVTMKRYSDHIARLLPKINVKNAIVGGSSMGGLVSLSFCFDHPEMTSALVLIDSPAKIQIDEKIVNLFVDDYEGTTRLAASLGYSKNTPKDVVEAALRYNLKVPVETTLKDLRATGRYDPISRLAEIRVPTLIIRGSEDILTPKPMSDILNNRIKGSTIKIIKGAGHSSIVEKPMEVSEAIMQFLRKQSI
ncbi:MAG: alpha/beta hydrolase [Promethearchaeati archaeon SRVP18_Atabeyarchaeia-1]